MDAHNVGQFFCFLYAGRLKGGWRAQVRHLPADGVRAGRGRRARGVAGRARAGERAGRRARGARPGDAARRQHDVQPQARAAPAAPRRAARASAAPRPARQYTVLISSRPTFTRIDWKIIRITDKKLSLSFYGP